MCGYRAMLLALGLAAAIPAGAAQTMIPDYETAREDYFWPLLYDIGGQTLYCGSRFAAGSERTADGRRVTLEHVYPADWIAEANGCDNRDDCPVEAYQRAAADLHNLWPALGGINSSRSNLPYGVLPGERERRMTDRCPDYERSSGADAVVEPRDSVKGEIARTLLYMADAYGLPLRGMATMLLRWHAGDPVDDMERWRAYAIERMQGTRNPYVLGGD